MLNYFKVYIPQYNVIIAPIIDLLSNTEPVWTSSHTSVVTTCVQALLDELSLIAPDFNE